MITSRAAGVSCWTIGPPALPRPQAFRRWRGSMDTELVTLADHLGHDLKQAGRSVATAESCTGGWLGAVLTSIPGSSLWYERGFVSYSNMAKREMLGVKTETLTRHGAGSGPHAAGKPSAEKLGHAQPGVE